jgi:membrane protease subunit (stomatin/prohibitin family)
MSWATQFTVTAFNVGRESRQLVDINANGDLMDDPGEFPQDSAASSKMPERNEMHQRGLATDKIPTSKAEPRVFRAVQGKT